MGACSQGRSQLHPELQANEPENEDAENKNDIENGQEQVQQQGKEAQEKGQQDKQGPALPALWCEEQELELLLLERQQQVIGGAK